MSPSLPQEPLIIIVGATGTGKSQLAVALAERFNGEIINTDALQMYEGLPIITNKIPVEDRRDIPHYLLGCVKLCEEPWTVRRFRDRASRIIEAIRSKGKLPILVGGTHYYTQSLLFRNTAIEVDTEYVACQEQSKKWPVLDASTEEILEHLRKVDPGAAMRWHPKDRRKIRRSLEIWLTTGKKASDLYDEQRKSQSGRYSDDFNNTHLRSQPIVEDANSSATDLISPMLYNPLIFWIHASADILNQRLEERVDKMIAEGLLEEVKSMSDFLQASELEGMRCDRSRGIWIAIGFKEFLPSIRSGQDSGKLIRDASERTKIATRQYAKSQNRWIRVKLQRALALADASSNLFLLDGTETAQWSEEVEARAKDIVSKFLQGIPFPRLQGLTQIGKDIQSISEEEQRRARYCTACAKTLMTERQWIHHLESKGHKRAVRPKVDWRALYPKATNI